MDWESNRRTFLHGAAALLDRRGWSSTDIERLFGLNWLRLLKDTIG
ncbi:hypothetical protein NOR53_813 [gamma proteobacterium NOR5-3]|nr:hypothetical protein NOR53_813 [gamma proteobacterium NOR5-3]